jgi:hypothetical protein
MPFGQRLARWSHREAVRTYGKSHYQEWQWEDMTYKRKLGAHPNRYHSYYPEKVLKQYWRYNMVQWRKQIKGLPFDAIKWANNPNLPGIEPRLAPNFVTFTELNRLRKRNGLRPLVRRKSHPFRWANAGENLGRFLRK